MTVINLITTIESDTYNARSEDWLALSDPEKSHHIFNASLYMQNRWSCVDVDWEDETTLTDEQKRACAYYADADRLGLLYAKMEAPEINTSTGKLIELTTGVGPLKETLRWSETNGASSDNPLDFVDNLMMIGCTRLNSRNGKVIRV